jgi:hypothetical protein
MNLIDRETLLDVVDTVVQKRGEDYVYPDWEALRATEPDDLYVPDSCHYVWTQDDVEAGKAVGLDLMLGEPACLAGAVFAEMGILDQVVPSHETDDAVSSLEAAEEVFTNEALIILQAGQSSQDRGDTWGKARDLMRTWKSKIDPNFV